MNIPGSDNLLQTLKTLLEGFDPTTLMYLDDQGHWRRDPSTLRDRISNELWFRIWEAKQNQDDTKQIKSMIYPFMRNENSWNVTTQVFYAIHTENNKGITNFLVVTEVLYYLIEYDACKRNSEAYVADWDNKGRAERNRYLQKTEKLLNDLKRILGTNAKIDNLFKTIDLQTADEGCIFNKVSLIISEEEKIGKQIEDLLTNIRDSKRKDEIFDFISEEISPAVAMTTRVPQALLRPCLELLTNPSIAISSGIPFEASSILGALKDIRCKATLLNALDDCDLKHTNLRCNLIYALGNLRQRKALNHFIQVLEGPDFIKSNEDSPGYNQSLHLEKCEAIWALGKMSNDAVDAVAALMRYADSPDREIKISLAWAMGMIGNGQKKKYGGIEAGILITLMTLLTAKDSETFEEAAFALRELDLPDFLHTIYLRNFATIPILSLKQSSIGLYELSETIFHLVSIKKPVVMAVTGDSGTGKTYFCQTIADGFSGLKEHEILYLMRDMPAHIKIFDRILGLKWLKEHIDPEYYQDYPLTEDEDNPESFFNTFMREHANKKLIILDGWRDEAFFHQVIRKFYDRGYLDVIVKFQTTFSTRRINLEEREGSLEKVKNFLPLVEELVIEETEFYREGDVLIYNLDNSIPSRLNKEEIFEIFQRKKVDTWGDQIRIGRFERNVKPLRIYDETLSSRWEDVPVEIEAISPEEPSRFTPSEASFSRILNEDITLEPNLFQIIKLDNVVINRIAFYTQGQIACCGYDGTVGILTGLNDRIFYTHAHKKKVVRFAIVGEYMYSIDSDGELKVTSFHKNTIIHVGMCNSPVCAIASCRDSGIVTGHLDGTIRLWDIKSKQVKILKGHRGAVLTMAIDHSGRIYSGGEDTELRRWDIENNRVKILDGHKTPISAMGLYADGRIVTGTRTGGQLKKGERRDAKIRIVDFETDTCKIFHTYDTEAINAINVYFDGRVIVSIKAHPEQPLGWNLIITDPRPDFHQYKILGGHKLETRDCITMGPRIITCGSESNAEHTLRIWGTESYVKMEHDKTKLIPETMDKPPYYRSLF